MKKIILGLNLILIFSVLGFAQDSDKTPEYSKKRSDKKTVQNNKRQQNNDILLQSGTSIEAQLQQTLDVKKASVGDEVILTTTKTIKANGQTVVQKGARLIGRVTEVQQKTKDNTQSRLGVVFDRLEGKNLNAPISATIVSITQVASRTSVGDTIDSDISGSSTSSGNVSRSSSSGGGGGLLGGVTNTVGGTLNTTTSVVGGVTNTATSTVGGTTQTLGKTLNGIQITQSADATANGSTTLSSQNKNLRLEKGVTFQLRLTESVEN